MRESAGYQGRRRRPSRTQRALTLTASHLRDDPAQAGTGSKRHVRPRHAAMAVTASLLVPALAALLLIGTDSQTMPRALRDDPAIAELATFEAALDADPDKVTARDALPGHFTITKVKGSRPGAGSTVVGRISSATGICWELSIPSDAQKQTSIAQGTRCSNTPATTPTSSPSKSSTTPGRPGNPSSASAPAPNTSNPAR